MPDLRRCTSCLYPWHTTTHSTRCLAVWHCRTELQGSGDWRLRVQMCQDDKNGHARGPVRVGPRASTLAEADLSQAVSIGSLEANFNFAWALPILADVRTWGHRPTGKKTADGNRPSRDSLGRAHSEECGTSCKRHNS